MISLSDLYKKLIKIGIHPREVRNLIEGNYTISQIKYWAYQDFILTGESNVTLTSNENATVALPPESILNGTALLSTTDGKPVGTFLFRKSVTAHTGTSVTFNTGITGTIRVWWLQMGSPPAGITIAPKFIRSSIASYLDNEYVNQQGDETITGTKTFDSIPKSNGTPTVNQDLITLDYFNANISAGTVPGLSINTKVITSGNNILIEEVDATTYDKVTWSLIMKDLVTNSTLSATVIANYKDASSISHIITDITGDLATTAIDVTLSASKFGLYVNNQGPNDINLKYYRQAI